MLSKTAGSIHAGEFYSNDEKEQKFCVLKQHGPVKKTQLKMFAYKLIYLVNAKNHRDNCQEVRS